MPGKTQRYVGVVGWPTTLMLVNAVGYLAEAAYHHPDLAVTWGKLWVKLKTHSAGGITDKDFALAKKIEEVVLWRPTKDGPLAGGTPNKFVSAKK
jgi:4a-hydroxytetrahydrobiopterin dehydratase